MTIQELTEQAFEKMKVTGVRGVLPALRAANDGAREDVLNTNASSVYQWLPRFIEVVEPKQIVELGGAMGVGDIMMLNSSYQDFILYSITMPEGGLEFSYVVDKYLNFVPVVGNDLDLSSWPKDLDLSKIDLWYFDSDHTEKQLRAELDLYSPFFKKGAIVLFDDIHLNEEMERVWEDIKNGKYGLTDCFDATHLLHWSGFGCCKV